MSDRAEFEKWQSEEKGRLEFGRYEFGSYVDDAVEDDWRVWQAARQAPASGEVEPGSRKEFWQNLERFANDYINGYEFRGDDGDYSPSEKEQFLIEDCVADLLHEMDNEGYLSTHPPAKVPEGWKLVPIESTSDMDIAGMDSLHNSYEGYIIDRDAAEVIWNAMVGAAPPHHRSSEHDPN